MGLAIMGRSDEEGGEMIKFATDEWIRALMEVINKSEAYAQAARNWEGDFYFIVEPGDLERV
jgi:hypothetical protein